MDELTIDDHFMVNEPITPLKLNHNDDDNIDILLCNETLEQKSPEIWPEKVAGVREMILKNSPLRENDRREWHEITIDDRNLVAAFANMKPKELRKKIEGFINLAFELQVEEEKEINRARIIDVFGAYKQPSNGDEP